MPCNFLRRKNLWISTGTQLRIILYSMFSAIILGLFMSWCIYAMLWKEISENASLVDGTKSPMEAFATLFPNILPQALAVFGLVLLCVVGIGLIMSHQIAGPAHRIKKAFTQIGSGDLGTRVHLRKMDGFKDVASSLNEAVETLEQKEEEHQRLLDAAREALAALPDDLQDGMKLTPDQIEKIGKARSLIISEKTEVETP